MESPWKPIKTFRLPDRHEVDIWLQAPASPRSMGWADAWRVIEAYRINEKWFHRQDGKEMEIVTEYVTHWMPIPKPPPRRQ
jgi:hypothetical protein